MDKQSQPQPSAGKSKQKDGQDLEFLSDVALPVSVQMGRTEVTIRDFLKLGVGSVLELNKMSDEPFDILANGRIVAKGEVVVVNDSFGIRVTQIELPDGERDLS